VLKPEPGGVTLLDNRPFIDLWMTKDLLGLQIAREGQRIRGELGFSGGKTQEQEEHSRQAFRQSRVQPLGSTPE
jgi:hypothetical protein